MYASQNRSSSVFVYFDLTLRLIALLYLINFQIKISMQPFEERNLFYTTYCYVLECGCV